jgi:hypothetical protein
MVVVLLPVDLDDARESLAFWERRSRGLPRWALRRRREARAMAARWRVRVDQAERSLYGAGFGGTLLQLLTERRLPLRTRAAGRRAARTGTRVAAGLALVTALVLVAAVELLAAVVHALA